MNVPSLIPRNIFRFFDIGKALAARISFFVATVQVVVICLFLISHAYASGVNLTVTILGNTQCIDGMDNDGDGEIDYPADPGCASTNDNDETDPPSGGGGGGGAGSGSSGGVGQGQGSGGGGSDITPLTTVIFRGKSYPESEVTLLKDGQVAATTKAAPNADFETRLSGLSAGTYTFGVRGEDPEGRRSTTHAFTVSATQGVATVVSGIFLSPTISLDKTEIKRGDILRIFGRSTPGSNVSIVINSDTELTKRAIADNSGVWLYQFDTSEVSYGDHAARSRSVRGAEVTPFSNSVGFKVGTRNVLAQVPVKALIRGDFNHDGRVNLVDFSIAAYWYKRTLSESFKALEFEEANGDAKIDLVDFSIMAFYWTG